MTLPIMFSKTILAFLAFGALYVNAVTVPIIREPAPQLECEFSRLFIATSHYDLTFVSFDSPRS